MRLTHLFALATAAGALTTAASAQDSRASTESRARIAARAYSDSHDDQPSHRAALGVGTGTTGTLRDTLGLIITSITRGSPAEKAGLEEGNRLVAINGVSLRVSAADIEDAEMSNALTRRLTRELGKAKPGDDVELRVYRDGRTQTVKVKTADSDVLFRRDEPARFSRSDAENRPALGIGIGSSGSRRDTLGVLIMSVSDSSPASKAGLEEGNRIAAIHGVNLKVAREDAGDRWISNSKAQRLQREIADLKPADNVTLSVYSNGRFRDVTMKVARAGDLPKNRGGMMFMNGDGMMPFVMPVMPAMPSMPAMPRMAPMAPMRSYRFDDSDLGETVRQSVRTQLENLRPQLEQIGPEVRMQLETLRPQLERLRMELPRLLESRRAGRIRMVNVIV